MSAINFSRSQIIQNALQAYLDERLNEALSKIKGTDAMSEKERQKQCDFFELQGLLTSGAECLDQIQIATHILKAIHPDPKVKMSTNLKIDPATLPELICVGSHVLKNKIDFDATGNGAFNKKIYELFRLLQICIDGESILDMLKHQDTDAIAALSDHPEQAEKSLVSWQRSTQIAVNKRLRTP